MTLNDEITGLIAKLDSTLAEMTRKWKSAETEPEKRKWYALINKGLDERLDLMRMRGN